MKDIYFNDFPCEEKACSLSCNGTCTVPPPPITIEKLRERITCIMPGPLPLFYTSNIIDPDDCFKIAPGKLLHWACYESFNFDKNIEEVYICGKNVRDSLIKKGVAFQNYNPEDEK
jgi:hypothetical protein